MFALSAVIALIAVAAVLSGGCGGNAVAHDPFVGTWQQAGDQNPNPLIVSKASDGYLVTIALPSVNAGLPATRNGDTLSGTFGPRHLRFEVVYVPSSGHLTWANSRTPKGPLNRPDDLVKTSDSTTLPTPTKS